MLSGQIMLMDRWCLKIITLFSLFFFLFTNSFEHLFNRLTTKMAELCKSWIQQFLTITTQRTPNYIELKQMISCSKFKSWILTLILLTPDALVTKRINVFLRSKNKTLQLLNIATMPTANEKFPLAEKKGWQEGTLVDNLMKIKRKNGQIRPNISILVGGAQLKTRPNSWAKQVREIE